MENKSFFKAEKLGFDFGNLKGDFMGGLTGAIIALPMGLAFGIQSGLGATAGLYTAIILAIVAAFVGGTKTLLSDPTGPMTIVAATVVSGALHCTGENIENAMPIILATFMLAGILQFLFGMIGIAKFVKFMPYPVVSGFMGGIGVIIIILQIFPIMGHVSPKGIIEILKNLDVPLINLNHASLFLGMGTLAIIYIIPMIHKKLPGILIALLIMTSISMFIEADLPRIGEIPAGLPTLQVGLLWDLQINNLWMIFVPAITLAALGTIDTLLTSTIADSLTKTRHNGNKELKGQGLGNLISAMFGGIPGAGATMGTVTNINSGGKTNLSGIFKGISLLTIVIGLGQYVQYIPNAVLAGILVNIGIGIIDIKGLKLLRKVPLSDSLVLIITLLVTIFDNLLDAVALGTMISFIFFMKNMSDAASEGSKVGLLGEILKVKELPDALGKNVYIMHLEGPLFFGFADDFKTRIEKIKDVKDVVFHLNHVPFMDETGMLVLQDAIYTLENNGMNVHLTGIKNEVEEELKKLNIIPNYINEDEVYDNLDNCMEALATRYDCDSFKEAYENLLEEALRQEDKLLQST